MSTKIAGVTVIGAGPAGSTAAISARRAGAEVTLFDKSKFPRQKVCGEFLSPDAALIFEELGISASFRELHPFLIREARVRIGNTEKRWTLPEPAFGISRYALDLFLLREAERAGARFVREPAKPGSDPVVVAWGRHASGPAGHRLFGFKAHFSGPTNDSIDLFFDRDLYTGMNRVENGLTNVCALASETLLRRFDFDMDKVLASAAATAERIRPLARTMDWLITGPLIPGQRFARDQHSRAYHAGDSLGFVDPFTGSGMLGAIATGFLAGDYCARGVPLDDYWCHCRELLDRQYRSSSVFRKLLEWRVAGPLASFVSGERLFDWTRPKVGQMIGRSRGARALTADRTN